MEATHNRILFIPFLSGNLICVIVEDEPYVVISPIIQSIGLEEHRARRTILSRKSYENKIAYVQFPQNWGAESALSFEKEGVERRISLQKQAVSAPQFEQLKGYKYLTLHLSKIASWLNNIHLGKVKPQIRDLLLQYQTECDEVLYEYFFKKTLVYTGHINTIADCKAALPALKETAYQTKEMKAYVEMDNKRLNAEKALFNLKKQEVTKQMDIQF